MGETRVDLLRLLEDLRDAYPGSIEETILTEVVANALDSGARRIDVFADPVAATWTVADDGKGMSRAALARYHDLAVTSKRRGRGIGFAGVGIKLGLLVSDEVLTETRTPRARRPLAPRGASARGSGPRGAGSSHPACWRARRAGPPSACTSPTRCREAASWKPRCG